MSSKFPAVIMYNDYLKMEQKQGVFALLDLDGCFICDSFLKEIKNYDISTWTIVALSEKIQDVVTPTTIVYDNNKIVYSKSGLLFAKQMREIFEFDKQEIVNNSVFVEATTKKQNVQAMFIKSDSNITLLGKPYELKMGQWLVLWEDNKVDVYDNREFESRFEVF